MPNLTEQRDACTALVSSENPAHLRQKMREMLFDKIDLVKHFSRQMANLNLNSLVCRLDGRPNLLKTFVGMVGILKP